MIMGLSEIVLGIWLIGKGFNSTEVEYRSI